MSSSIYVVAAMCGCWRRESGVNPGIWESLIPCAWNYKYEYKHKGGYGLGQWTNVGTSDGRLWKLHTWVTNNGYGDGNGDGQLAYLTVENWWNGNYNGTGDNSKTHGTYGSLSAFLNSDSTNIADLVWDFLANWEGVPGDHYQERLNYANNFLSYLQAHAGEVGSWTTGNRYLSVAQMQNNVLAIYNTLGNGAAPPEPPEQDTHAITVITSGRGSASASKSYAKQGETINLTATADDGAEFEKWNVLYGDISIVNNSFTMPDTNVSIEAIFSGAYELGNYPLWLFYQWRRIRERNLHK